MFRIPLGRTSRYCDGVARRSFLQLGLAGMGSWGMGDLLRARSASAANTGGKSTSVILIWLDGGPAHMDTYDPKPNAPEIYRGFWNPIATNVQLKNLLVVIARAASPSLLPQGRRSGCFFISARRLRRKGLSVFRSGIFESTKMLRGAYALKLLEDHKARRRNNARKIWTLFILALWLEKYR